MEKVIESTAAIVMRGGRRFARWYTTAMVAFGSLWAVGVVVNDLRYWHDHPYPHADMFLELIVAVIMAGTACVVAALPMAVVLFVLFAAFAK